MPAIRTGASRRCSTRLAITAGTSTSGVERAGLALRRELLELRLDLVEHVEIEQVAKLAASDQFAQEVAIERERLRLALGERCIAFVEKRRDVIEHERPRERRRGLGVC